MIVVVVGAGWYQQALVRAVAAQGHESVAVDRDPAAPALSLADHPLLCSAHDGAAIVAALQTAGLQPEAVISGGARGCIRATAEVAAAFDLPGLAVRDAAIIADKTALRRALNRVGANPLPCTEVNSADAAAAFVATHGRAVIKPAGTSGSQGIAVVEGIDTVATAFARAAAFDTGVLIEGFAPGVDVGVAGLSSGGRAVVCAVYRKQGRHSYCPAGLAPERAAAVVDASKQAMVKLGVGVGPWSIEWRVAEQGAPVMIECEACMPGSFIAEHLVPATSGRDYLAAALASCCGEAGADADWPAVQRAEVRFLDHPESADDRPLPFATWGGPGAARCTTSPLAGASA